MPYVRFFADQLILSTKHEVTTSVLSKNTDFRHDELLNTIFTIGIVKMDKDYSDPVVKIVVVKP